MMALARGWTRAPELYGPYAVTPEDIPPLNEVFSDAFTDRYRKDGLAGVRVPALNPAVWRFAIADADGGAMLWRDGRGDVVAFNIVHASGTEGWMGPLAVRPDCQGQGVGKAVVLAGVDWLERRGARVIGLETMPRTVDNVGFYSSLGFVPGHLTITITLDAAHSESTPLTLSRLAEQSRSEVVEQCAALVASHQPGYDYTREILLTHDLMLGDTVVVRYKSVVVGFALCHTVPLVEGRIRDELRVLKLVASGAAEFDLLIRQLLDFAKRGGIRRVAFRMQGEYPELYRMLVARGGRVRWTDLRMSEARYMERRAPSGIVLSNWEI